MSLCRAALQRCGPMARHFLTNSPFSHLNRNVVSRRTMSSVPGGSGENIAYFLLCGGALAASVAYTYSTVTSDHARFMDRVTDIQSRPKDEWKPKPWPPKSRDEDEEAL
ncbi:protein MGARP isoform X5 [Clupea harengus]|uniref:Protein MGARP isoform X5 n=1 Tax=Clupea harengus TaxID=7950 RepID=A0A6P8H5R1_CLUHA|nr:protein MGARP isoform X5 [Clupea harengus]